MVGLFAAGDTVNTESMALCLTATEHYSEVDSFVQQMARKVLEFHPNGSIHWHKFSDVHA